MTKKYYTGAIFRGLTHEKAKCKCLLNPDFVMTRKEWSGYHFIEDNEYYILNNKGHLLHLGSCLEDLSDKVYNINDNDWIVAFRNNTGKLLEENAKNN
jgi:hypothetical protein